MLIKIFKKQKVTKCMKAVEYLCEEQNNKQQARQGSRILKGDPYAVAELSDSLEFSNKQTVGVLSFEEENIPEQHKFEIIERFEDAFFAGLEKQDYAIAWVEHTDKNRLELNFVVANVNLASGKRLQPFYHKSDLTLKDSFCKVINHEYNLTQYDDPEKKQNLRLSQAELKGENKQNVQNKKALTEHLTEMFELGYINNRQELVEYLTTQLNMTIHRETANSISVRNADEPNSKSIKLKGEIYERNYKKLSSREDSESKQRYARESSERYAKNLQRLNTAITNKSERNRSTYSRKSSRSESNDHRQDDTLNREFQHRNGEMERHSPSHARHTTTDSERELGEHSELAEMARRDNRDDISEPSVHREPAIRAEERAEIAHQQRDESHAGVTAEHSDYQENNDDNSLSVYSDTDNNRHFCVQQEDRRSSDSTTTATENARYSSREYATGEHELNKAISSDYHNDINGRSSESSTQENARARLEPVFISDLGSGAITRQENIIHSSVHANKQSVQVTPPNLNILEQKNYAELQRTYTQLDRAVSSVTEQSRATNQLINSSTEQCKSSEQLLSNSTERARETNHLIDSSEQLLSNSTERARATNQLIDSSEQGLASSTERLTSVNSVFERVRQGIKSIREFFSTDDRAATEKQLINNSAEQYKSSEQRLASSAEQARATNQLINNSTEQYKSSEQRLASSTERLTRVNSILAKIRNGIKNIRDFFATDDRAATEKRLINNSTEQGKSSEQRLASSTEQIRATNQLIDNSAERNKSDRTTVSSLSETIRRLTASYEQRQQQRRKRDKEELDKQAREYEQFIGRCHHAQQNIGANNNRVRELHRNVGIQNTRVRNITQHAVTDLENKIVKLIQANSFTYKTEDGRELPYTVEKFREEIAGHPNDMSKYAHLKLRMKGIKNTLEMANNMRMRM